MGTKVRVNRNQNRNQAAPSAPAEDTDTQSGNQMTTAASEDAALDEAVEVVDSSRENFQSEDARDAAVEAAAPPEDEDEDVVTEAVEAEVVTPVIPTTTQMRMRKVRPLRTEKRVRVGKNWYNFVQGKECLVPNHVYLLLQQKGLFS